MSAGYRAVLWNRQKIVYDALLVAAVGGYLLSYQYLVPMLDPHAEAWNVRMRAYGSCAFLLLHIILSIGPLARLDRRFLPLLYNRRHMGVTLAVLALFHLKNALTWYHDFSPALTPWVSLLVSNTRVSSYAQFPFEYLGLGALVIILMMAVTSHDFWLHQLTAPVWKRLHMLVYWAYFLLVGHVTLGALYSNPNPALMAFVLLGLLWLLSLHILAGRKEALLDQPSSLSGIGEDKPWIDVGPAEAIPNNRAKIVFAGGDRVAVFRYGDKISAVSNACQHQNGPLGEGRIIDGFITCPWHGYQYIPESGASPAPFSEKIPTFRVKVEGRNVWLDPTPLPAGTRVEPARIEENSV